MFEVNEFTPQAISGIVDKEGAVELFDGQDLVESVTPVYNSERNVFLFSFRNPFWPVVGARSLTVRGAGYLNGPEIGEAVIGYIPRRFDLGRAMKVYHSRMVNYPEVPTQILYYVGSGPAGQVGYRLIGYSLFSQMLSMTGFRMTDHVLDVGAGAGRIGFAVAPYLQGGTYLGVDTWAEGITWATANLKPLFPSTLRFETLPSPPQGRRQGYLSEYVAPIDVGSSSFDLVICTSLFTHLRESACLGYLEHIARVLRPGGLAFITTYLIQRDEAVTVRSTKINNEDESGLYIVDETYCDSFLYADSFFSTVAKAALKVCRYSPGVWIGDRGAPSRCPGENYQDILVLRKA